MSALPAAIGLQVVEEIAARLTWDGAPAGFPEAKSFLVWDGGGQRDRARVFLISETARSSVGGRGAVVQIVTAELGVLMLLPTRNTRGGAAARAKVEPWIDASRQRLLGHAGGKQWRPPSLREPLTFIGGALEPVAEDGSYWAWMDRYSGEWVLNSQSFNGA